MAKNLENKILRCKKLHGRKVPRTCHVLNGRKSYCEDLIETEGQEEINIAEFGI